MVWSKEDFVREVRRQMVELESLRRKIEAESDIQETLERLEESQVYLLRKLNDYFQAQPEETPGVPEGIPGPIGEYIQHLLEEPSLLEQLVEREPGASIVIVGITGSASTTGSGAGSAHAKRFGGGFGPGYPPPYSLN